MGSCLLHFDDEIMQNPLKVMADVPARNCSNLTVREHTCITSVYLSRRFTRPRTMYGLDRPNPVFMQ